MRTVLHADVRNRGARRRLALIHGFTQSASAWELARTNLGDQFETIALDAPGHGGSATIEVGLQDGADMMVQAVLAAGSGGPAAWLGYSMGGRFALHVALAHPQAVTNLVLVSATAGIDDPAERAARSHSDGTLAERIEREGVESFLAWWLAQPLFSTLATDAANLESRLGGSASGLASSLRLAGSGTQEPLWDRLGTLDMPVLVLAGELDAKYCALARRIVQSVGSNADLVIIPGAGHACHLERPGDFLEEVTIWLAGH